jgi:glycosyltransferase involved in cell wall biosynthesis
MSLFKETLDSILCQEEKSFEVIVVNDGSSKEASDWLTQHVSKIESVRLINQENTGPGTARNNGVKKAQGDYIIFLDSDDLMTANCLSSFKSQIDLNQDKDVFIGDCEYFGGRNELKVQKEPAKPSILAYNSIIVSAAIKRSFLGEDIRFEPFLDRIGLEDWEFWISCVEANAKFHHISRSLFKIRVNQESRTYQTANNNKSIAIKFIYEKHAVSIQNEMEGLIVNNRELRTSLNTRIGDLILTPYRLVKKVFS